MIPASLSCWAAKGTSKLCRTKYRYDMTSSSPRPPLSYTPPFSASTSSTSIELVFFSLFSDFTALTVAITMASADSKVDVSAAQEAHAEHATPLGTSPPESSNKMVQLYSHPWTQILLISFICFCLPGVITCPVKIISTTYR